MHGAGQFSYTRAANSALTYTVWTSTDLSDWGTVPAAATQVPRVPAVNSVETVDVTLTGYTHPPGGKLFVRVKTQCWGQSFKFAIMFDRHRVRKPPHSLLNLFAVCIQRPLVCRQGPPLLGVAQQAVDQ